jgi:hypothetical protein
MSATIEQKPRHYCRNPKCRSKLPTPTGNGREAFCTRGCHSSFYRHRCIVCERAMPRNAGNQRTCYRADCKDTWRKRLISSRFLQPDPPPSYRGSANDKLIAEVPVKAGTKTGDTAGRAVHISAGEHWTGTWHTLVPIAGPVLSANNYTSAVVGAGEALAASDRLNAAHWRSAKAGEWGYRKPAAPISEPAPIASPSLVPDLPDDLSIPAFLRREAVRR